MLELTEENSGGNDQIVLSFLLEDLSIWMEYELTEETAG